MSSPDILFSYAGLAFFTLLTGSGGIMLFRSGVADTGSAWTGWFRLGLVAAGLTLAVLLMSAIAGNSYLHF